MLPSIVLVNILLCPNRKLKKRMSRMSRSLPGGGGPSRRACLSQCLSAILGMGRKTISARPGVGRTSPAVRLCHHHKGTVSKALEVLICLLQKTPPHLILPLEQCTMSRRGSLKARVKSTKVYTKYILLYINTASIC